MMRRTFMLLMAMLLAPVLFAETPSVTSNSGIYDMESTIKVVGTAGEFQTSGVYSVSGQFDSGVQVPVELSAFEIE